MVYWNIPSKKNAIKPQNISKLLFILHFFNILSLLQFKLNFIHLPFFNINKFFFKKHNFFYNFLIKPKFNSKFSKEFFIQDLRWSKTVSKRFEGTSHLHKIHTKLESLQDKNTVIISRHKFTGLKFLTHTFIRFYAASSLHKFRPAKAYRRTLFSPGPAAGSYIIDLKRFFSRWRHLYFLLLNVFYFKSRSLTFGSYFSRNEVLALNWNSQILTLSEWKNISPMFFSKVKNFSWMFLTLMYRLKQRGLSIVFVSDPFVSRYLYLYAGKSNIFSIGLYPAVEMPWIASFPVPSFGYGGASQIFFLQLVHSLNRKAKLLNYNNYYQTWFLLNLKK